MYSVIRIISTLLRAFILPNPFEQLPEPFSITVMTTQIAIPAEILNWLAEAPLHLITFSIVGLYYEKGSNPAVGSFLYLLFYCVHTAMLYIMAGFQFAPIAVVMTISVYIAAQIGVASIMSKINSAFRFR